MGKYQVKFDSLNDYDKANIVRTACKIPLGY